MKFTSLKTVFILYLITAGFFSSYAQEKEICITLDDLPVVSYDFKDIAFQKNVIDKLIETFDTYQIPAIGFVNENKLYHNGRPDAGKIQLLKTWLEAGYELGNHTYSHPDYHKVSYDRFTKNILKGEKVCKPLTAEYRQPYKYFRHPFLHVGLSKAKHDSLKIFLSEHGYSEAPVTIDNDDYIFAYAYSKALFAEDVELINKIKADYVDYMEDKLLYFEKQSKKLFGRNMKQILLLHANAINADCLGALAERFVKHGYRFISLEDALEDEAFDTQITYYGRSGISWIDRWALSAGKTGDFFEGDPNTPDYVQAILEHKQLYPTD